MKGAAQSYLNEAEPGNGSHITMSELVHLHCHCQPALRPAARSLGRGWYSCTHLDCWHTLDQLLGPLVQPQQLTQTNMATSSYEEEDAPVPNTSLIAQFYDRYKMGTMKREKRQFMPPEFVDDTSTIRTLDVVSYADSIDSLDGNLRSPISDTTAEAMLMQYMTQSLYTNPYLSTLSSDSLNLNQTIVHSTTDDFLWRKQIDHKIEHPQLQFQFPQQLQQQLQQQQLQQQQLQEQQQLHQQLQQQLQIQQQLQLQRQQQQQQQHQYMQQPPQTEDQEPEVETEQPKPVPPPPWHGLKWIG